ncbi:MAG: SDR family NAD(P)-dependent oxidoreductase, partial [Proteobacteria bacterium]|nr:SDR family NAD(P)-dependent oxidoreductase [Pseudomonadota bacterium]
MNKEVVFISGASRGIGTAIAESFAKLGHTVIEPLEANL